MAFRFVEGNEEFIEELRNASENQKHKKKSDYWTNIYNGQRQEQKNEQLETYEVQELHEALAQFFALYMW